MTEEYTMGFEDQVVAGSPHTVAMATLALRGLRVNRVRHSLPAGAVDQIDAPREIRAGETAEVRLAYNGYTAADFQGLQAVHVVLSGPALPPRTQPDPADQPAPSQTPRPTTPPAVLHAAIAFLRETFRNDGAEGESVHLVCGALEEQLAALPSPGWICTLPFPGWVCTACHSFNDEAKERRPVCRACNASRPFRLDPPLPSETHNP